MNTFRFLALLAVMALGSQVIAVPAHADITVGSDGSDGTLVVTSNTTIDLSAAATTTWSSPSPVPGKGVYDPQQWAVVFKYDSVYVGPTAALSFVNHPTTAPVVWLVARGVSINGTVSLNGSGVVLDGVPAAPGPGGFRGGKGGTSLTGGGGAGMGPGGGAYSTVGGGSGGR